MDFKCPMSSNLSITEDLSSLSALVTSILQETYEYTIPFSLMKIVVKPFRIVLFEWKHHCTYENVMTLLWSTCEHKFVENLLLYIANSSNGEKRLTRSLVVVEKDIICKRVFSLYFLCVSYDCNSKWVRHEAYL